MAFDLKGDTSVGLLVFSFMSQTLPPHTTLTYKRFGDRDVYLDVYPPTANPATAQVDNTTYVPALIYFHGGGLTVGNRTSWFPYWLHRRTVDLGIAFLSPDYQLVPPGTGHDVLSDILDLFSYLGSQDTIFRARREDIDDGVNYKIDLNAIALAGSSAGGLCAYLAAGVVRPKPKFLLSMYGMGGDLMTPYYIEPKHEVFVPGREMLEPERFGDFLYPFALSGTTDSELEYHLDDHPTPGLPANPRMYLGRLYLQLGTYLDYYTGDHTPSLSEALRSKWRECLVHNGVKPQPEVWGGSLIPEHHRVLFPQLNITSGWPEVFLIHGTDDYQVHLHESQHIKELLGAVGVQVTLRAVEGKGHSFDYHQSAEIEFSGLFDEVAEFLRKKLGRS